VQQRIFVCLSTSLALDRAGGTRLCGAAKSPSARECDHILVSRPQLLPFRNQMLEHAKTQPTWDQV